MSDNVGESGPSPSFVTQMNKIVAQAQYRIPKSTTISQLLTDYECDMIVGIAKSMDLSGSRESPSPLIRLLDYRLFIEHNLGDTMCKLHNALISYANSNGIEIYTDVTTFPIRILYYRPGDFTPWHVDYKDGSERKVSMSVQLSMHTGGMAFEIIETEGITRYHNGKGSAILFPGWTAHRAYTDLGSKGRWALAMWFSGPRVK